MEEKILRKIKNLRENREVDVIELAKYLGIEVSAYYKMENGTQNTWGKYLFSLLDFYQLSPKDFFNDIEGKNFIHQENTDFKDSAQAFGFIEKQQYADKTIVKSLLAQKDKTIELLEKRIEQLEQRYREQK